MKFVKKRKKIVFTDGSTILLITSMNFTQKNRFLKVDHLTTTLNKRNRDFNNSVNTFKMFKQRFIRNKELKNLSNEYFKNFSFYKT